LRATPNLGIELFRRVHPILGVSSPWANWGCFQIGHLHVIASDELGWDHVSVSRRDRVPSWDEMCRIKRLWFDDDETVIQYHPKASEYVNNCRNCLHLWKKQGVEFELPPTFMVGTARDKIPEVQP
jgi:hypothetical protein